jgi:hypothetical protein
MSGWATAISTVRKRTSGHRPVSAIKYKFRLFARQRWAPLHMANMPIDGGQKDVAFEADNADNLPGHNMKIRDWLDVYAIAALMCGTQ